MLYPYWNSPEAQKKFSTLELRHPDIVIQWLKKFVRPDSLLVDIGCAAGVLYASLEKHEIRCSYLGVDSSRELLAQAKHSYPEAKFVYGDAIEPSVWERIPKANFVVLLSVLSHESRWKLAFENISGGLRVGGIVLVNVFVAFHQETINRINDAYCHKKDPVPLIIANIAEFLDTIEQNGLLIKDISLTKKAFDDVVHLANSVDQKDIYSAYFLLQKGSQ